jgi:hypothetical protein
MKKKEGLLVPNRSVCGQLMAGKFTVPIALLLSVILTQVPWDALYQLSGYKHVIDVISMFSINIHKIPDTKNPFPEYSIAFLSFVNAVGPFYALVGSYCGVKHIQSTSDIPAMHVRAVKLAGFFFVFVLAILCLLWGALYFSGESTILENGFYRSEWRFVGFFTLLWIVTSMFCFSAAAIAFILLNRTSSR